MTYDWSSLTQPLVTQPAYGEGRPAMPVGESGLPGTGPSDRGMSLDKDIPGTSTFNKPENDIREPDKAEPGSIYRIDGPDDMAKPQDDQEGDELHHEQFKPTQSPPGARPTDDKAITKYPYRDDRPNRHEASEQAAFIVGLYRLRFAHEAVVRPDLSRVASTPVRNFNVRTAASLDDMLEGLNPKFEERGAACSVTVKRVDAGNLRWIFAVNCGNGPKVVRVKATREGNIVRLSRMDLNVSCSCKAWQYLGPEYHAKFEAYNDGKPRGTASYPEIKDPQLQNRVCKHVAAVLGHVRKWAVPLEKPKSKRDEENG